MNDDKLRDLGAVLADVWRADGVYIHLASKAYELIRPLVLAEALAEPTSKEWGSASYADECGKESRTDNDGQVFLSVYAVGIMLRNRLAALTQQPDPAVEAVRSLLNQNGRPYVPDLPDFIVAAVRKADKEKG